MSSLEHRWPSVSSAAHFPGVEESGGFGSVGNACGQDFLEAFPNARQQ